MNVLVSSDRPDVIEPVLSCHDLSVQFTGGTNLVFAVEEASFQLQTGRVLGVVGESGSGKSQLFLALTGLSTAEIVSGRVMLGQDELIGASEDRLRAVRGKRIAYIFQDPMTALNPYLRISTQLSEVATTHLGLDQYAAEQQAVILLDQMRIPDAKARLRDFPHELSGGMRQRVMIAMAMMGQPDILIADEPTTALDATVQIKILDLMRTLCDEQGVTIALITHDMGVMARVADDVLVMYAGRVVEAGPVESVLRQPLHPYTQRLIRAKPDLSRPMGKRISGIPGQLPTADASRDGCLFAPRCDLATDLCSTHRPQIRGADGKHIAGCHFPLVHSGVAQ